MSFFGKHDLNFHSVPQAGPSRSRSRSNFTGYRTSKLSSVSAPYKNTQDKPIVVTDSDEDVVEVSDERVQVSSFALVLAFSVFEHT